MKNQTDILIKNYLKQVKDKLPEWLKEDKDELEGILAELEDHIRNKAMDLSETEELTIDSVNSAMKAMGNPSKIAREYKKRGTPHVYITKELWPIYKKVLLIVFTIIACVSVFTMILNALMGNFQDAFNFGGYMLGFFAAFTIITIIFVFLSMEGYLPEDFISEAERAKKEKERKEAEEMGMPISPKTGEPLKSFVNTTEKIIGGAIGLIIAILMIAQPVAGFFNLMEVEFRTYLFLLGILILLDAFTTITRGILGNSHVPTHQAIQIFTIILKVIAIPIFILIILNPAIVPIIYWNGTTFINIGISTEYFFSFKVSMSIITAIIGASIASNVYQIIKLEKYKK